MYDTIIIGSGAAGLAAGLYAGRYRLKTLIVEGKFGGETATAGTIENYPGITAVDGYDLMKTMRAQAEGVGAMLKSGWVTKLEKKEDAFLVTINDKEVLETKTVIFAGGAEHRRLGLPREQELTGRGVHYCVTCDGPTYTGAKLIVVGGGDSAVKGVLLAAEYAEKIYMLVRGDKLRAEPINFEHLKALGDMVEVIYDTEITALVGEKMLEKVLLSKPYNGSIEFPIDGVFVEIGYEPKTALAAALGVTLDAAKYIETDAMMRTNVLGLFAAGDTVNHFGHFKQDITAAAMGSVAATSAYEYVKSMKG